MHASSDLPAAFSAPSTAVWMGSDDDRRFVHSVARRIVRDYDAANDVTQEAMLLAYRHRDKFRGDAHYRTWLYRIATTTALTYLRRERSWRRKCAIALEHATAEGKDGDAVVTETPADALGDRDTRALVERLLAALDEPYRRVFELRFCEGYSERETAEALGLTTGTVKIRMFRARRMLREQLGTLAPDVAIPRDAEPLAA